MISEMQHTKPRIKLHGGLQFDKVAAPPIETLPLADTLKIQRSQHQGLPATVIVTEGAHVTEGQPLTASNDLSQVPVHASSSGIITGIDQDTIIITTDKQITEDCRNSRPSNLTISREHLIRTLHNAGIVGMGGAGFPAAQKISLLSTSANVLLINAAECDPMIHCDDALMQSHAIDIVSGIKIIATACKLSTIVIGFEDNKPAAQKAITNALDQLDVATTIVTMPSVYPSGAENVMAHFCLDQNRQSASSQRLSAKGVLSFNIATCFAIYQAVAFGRPLISRITTVVDIRGTIRNFMVPVGTPLTHLFQQIHDSDTAQSFPVTTGGQMMSTPLNHDNATVKTSNCITFSLPASGTKPSVACIRCGACAEVCPEHLLPQQLHMHATAFNDEALHHYNLDQCIECGCCDAVCPSYLPLTTSFQNAKQQHIEIQQAKKLADIAKMRFEKRQHRLRNKTELRTRRAAIRKPALPDTPLITAANDKDQKKKQLIEAALQRKKNKKAENQRDRSDDK